MPSCFASLNSNRLHAGSLEGHRTFPARERHVSAEVAHATSSTSGSAGASPSRYFFRCFYPAAFRSRIASWAIAASLWICLSGCSEFNRPQASYPEKNKSEIADQNRVWAQGKLLPAGGIIQVTGIPGDRLESIRVRPGDRVTKGDLLVQLSSEESRRGELKLARQRLVEGKEQLEAKKVEAELKIQAAKAQLQQATAQQKLAQEQVDLVASGDSTVQSARDQISRIQKLRDDPRTSVMVGTIELEQKKIDLAQAEVKQNQAKLGARQTLDQALLAIDLAKQQLAAAQRGLELVESASPMKSMEDQIEFLERQIERSRIVAPCDGVILSVTSDPGEAVMQLPILEMADVSKMVCRAEVHESDMKRVSLGCDAELQSSALAHSIRGKVVRVDRMVGTPEMRIPDPLSKTDFRAIPVWIEIDSDDVEEASQLIQLQVQVSIQTR